MEKTLWLTSDVCQGTAQRAAHEMHLLQAKPLPIHSGTEEAPGIHMVYYRRRHENVDKTWSCLQEKAHRGEKSNKNINTNDV